MNNGTSSSEEEISGNRNNKQALKEQQNNSSLSTKPKGGSKRLRSKAVVALEGTSNLKNASTGAKGSKRRAINKDAAQGALTKVTTDFQQLPNDVVAKIFQFLPNKEFAQVPVVCTLWNNIAKRNDVYRARYTDVLLTTDQQKILFSKIKGNSPQGKEIGVFYHTNQMFKAFIELESMNQDQDIDANTIKQMSLLYKENLHQPKSSLNKDMRIGIKALCDQSRIKMIKSEKIFLHAQKALIEIKQLKVKYPFLYHWFKYFLNAIIIQRGVEQSGFGSMFEPLMKFIEEANEDESIFSYLFESNMMKVMFFQIKQAAAQSDMLESLFNYNSVILVLVVLELQNSQENEYAQENIKMLEKLGYTKQFHDMRLSTMKKKSFHVLSILPADDNSIEANKTRDMLKTFTSAQFTSQLYIKELIPELILTMSAAPEIFNLDYDGRFSFVTHGFGFSEQEKYEIKEITKQIAASLCAQVKAPVLNQNNALDPELEPANEHDAQEQRKKAKPN